jgi:hypothetical protein
MLYPLSNQFIQAAQHKKYVIVAVLSAKIKADKLHSSFLGLKKDESVRKVSNPLRCV